jgi:uncharacterized membrane protein
MEHQQRHAMQNQKHQEMQGRHYGKLFVMAILLFLSMYILMNAMLDKLSNVYPNINQFYMADEQEKPC